MPASGGGSNMDIGASKVVFEKIPNDFRPMWGKNILSLFDKCLIFIPAEVLTLYEIIDDKLRWKEAHNQFSKIRELNLENRNKEYEVYLLLAENIAKITYNASNEPAPFDWDSGWYIPNLAKQVSAFYQDAELDRRLKENILLSF